MGLEGKTVLLTRARGQNRELGRLLEAIGARVLEIPTIEIREPADWQPVDRAIGLLAEYDWVVFSSANAVDAFLGRVGRAPLPRVAVVGAQTARRAEARGVPVALVPGDYRSDGLLAAFPADLGGVRLLLPRGDIAGDELTEGLRARGARVDTVTVYRTTLPAAGGAELRRYLRSAEIDCVTFTSGSTLRNLVSLLDVPDPPACLSGIAIAVIGPVTRMAAEDLGLRVAVEPREATVRSLAEAIRDYFAGVAGPAGFKTGRDT